jgi:polar amino acid transport system substrate-binding protein
MFTRVTFATRLASLVLVGSMLSAATAFGQAATPAPPASGYADPTGIPLRPPVADIEPVWARPAVDTVATVRARGVLRVGVVPNEPFVMRDANGDLTGFSIDVGRQLAKDLGVDVQFVPTSWTQVISDLIGRQFDVIASGLWITPSRALVVNFSAPTSMGAMFLVANRAVASTMKTRQDFDKPGVRLVVYKGSSQESVASRLFPKATLVTIEGDADPVAALVDGKAHAVLLTTPTPKLFVNEAPDKLFQPFEEPLQVTTAALAVRKGDPDFLNYIDSWIAFQREGGWLADREIYWFKTTDWMKQM